MHFYFMHTIYLHKHALIFITSYQSIQVNFPGDSALAFDYSDARGDVNKMLKKLMGVNLQKYGVVG